jgi:hypothetical protein
MARYVGVAPGCDVHRRPFGLEAPSPLLDARGIRPDMCDGAYATLHEEMHDLTTGIARSSCDEGDLHGVWGAG